MAELDAGISSPEAPEKPARSPGGKGARLTALRDRFREATWDNPILVKEFRTRMRGARAYWIMLGYTLLIAAILAFVYHLHQSSVESGQGLIGQARAAQELGRIMYSIVFVTQAIMVALITPAITSGAITIEREQRSYELLVTTPLRPIDLIRGKLTAAVAFVVLLLTASLPLVSLTFLVGGVSPGEIFFSYVLIALGAYVAGSLGIFWSAALKSTAVSTVATYVTVMGLFLVTLVPGFIAMDARAGTGASPAVPFQSLNPVMGVFRSVQPEYLFNWQIPSWASASILLALFGTLITTQALGRLETFEPPRPAWSRGIATLFWIALGAFLLGPPLGEAIRNPGVNRSELTGMALCFVLVLCCFAVPIWNTGDLVVPRGEPALRRYLSGLSPLRMWGNNLPNGLPLTLLWVVLMVGMVPFGALTAGKLRVVDWRDVFLPGAVLITAVVYGFAGAGNLLSVRLPSRWAACLLNYALVIVVGLLPYFVLSPWVQEARSAPGPQWLFLYLVPLEGIGRLIRSESFWGVPIPLPVNPVWAVTSVLYAVLGTLCFALSAASVRGGAEGRRKDEGGRMRAEGSPAPAGGDA